MHCCGVTGALLCGDGAQTQGTLGVVLMNALDAALLARGVSRPTAALVSRTLVDADDPGFRDPTKPIGRHLPAAQAQVLVDRGQIWQDRGAKGWRRVVASPEPREIIDAAAVVALIAAGFVVIANGGGGVPVVRDADGRLRGVEAVIDKDLGAALLARSVGADTLVIGTDVSHAVLRWGTPQARPVGTVTVTQMRTLAAEGHFAGGSMGPKVDAACRFVEQGGRRAVITDLAHLAAAVTTDVGTVIVADGANDDGANDCGANDDGANDGGANDDGANDRGADNDGAADTGAADCGDANDGGATDEEQA